MKIWKIEKMKCNEEYTKDIIELCKIQFQNKTRLIIKKNSFFQI